MSQCQACNIGCVGCLDAVHAGSLLIHAVHADDCKTRRFGKRSVGRSIKLGCTARFSVTIQEGSGQATISYTQHLHVDAAGRPCHDDAVRKATGVACGLSHECKAFVAVQLARSVPPLKIVASEWFDGPLLWVLWAVPDRVATCSAVWQDHLLQPYLALGLDREHAAAKMLLGDTVPRDLCLTPADIANVQHPLDN